MRTALLILCLLLTAGGTSAQEPSDGLTLISPRDSQESFLIDLDHNVVQSWTGANVPAEFAYLLPGNAIIRPTAADGVTWGAGGRGGRIQRIRSNGVVDWDFRVADEQYLQHHDIEPLPNGNVLVLAWERIGTEEARAAGRQQLSDGEIWPTIILEYERVGPTEARVVWQWRLWDHLVQDVDPELPNYGVVRDHPERMDVNFGAARNGGDWDHANAISYNRTRDQIVISALRMHEFWVVDHSTTMEEASGSTGGRSGKGGDLLYRWGNPATYDREDTGMRYYYKIHGAAWIDCGLPGEGGILTFTNGTRRPGGRFSSVEEIQPPMDVDGNYVIEPDQAFGPVSPQWVYSGPPIFYSTNKSGAFRLPNGNTLITSANELYIFEVTPQGDIVWDYEPPAEVHRAPRYWSETTPHVVRLDLKPGSCPNVFNPRPFETKGSAPENALSAKGGVLPAAIVGSECLDVTQIDVSSLRLEGVAPLRASEEDVTGGNNAEACACDGDDPDGRPDLTLKFSRAELFAAVGSFEHSTKLTLTGALLDGTPIIAHDCLVPPGQPETPEGPKLPLISTDAVPNPFNPQTTIRYAVARAGVVSLNIFDAAGRRVRTLVDREYAVANEVYAVTWNGRDESGGRLASGVYFYLLDTEGGQERRKLLLLK